MYRDGGGRWKEIVIESEGRENDIGGRDRGRWERMGDIGRKRERT